MGFSSERALSYSDENCFRTTTEFITEILSNSKVKRPSFNKSFFIKEIEGERNNWDREFYFYIVRYDLEKQLASFDFDLLKKSYDKYKKEEVSFSFSKIFSDDQLRIDYPEVILWARDNYENDIGRSISQFKSTLEFKDNINTILSNFRILEKHFKGIDFSKWLEKNDKFSLSYIQKNYKDKKIGEFLTEEYVKFAPFIKSSIEKYNIDLPSETFMMAWRRRVNSVKNGVVACGINHGCIKDRFTRILKVGVKDNLSCTRRNPEALNAFVTNTLVSVAMISAMTYRNYDEMERIPWQLYLNTFIIAPIFAEYYCRASFVGKGGVGKSRLHNPLKISKPRELYGHIKKVFKMSVLSSVMYLSYDYGIDWIYEQAGHPMSDKGVVNKIKKFPFILVYGSIYGTASNIYFFNPINFKLFPHFAKSLQGIVRIPGVEKTVLVVENSLFKFGKSYYKTWEFQQLYLGKIVPTLLGFLKFNPSSAIAGEIEE